METTHLYVSYGQHFWEAKGTWILCRAHQTAPVQNPTSIFRILTVAHMVSEASHLVDISHPAPNRLSVMPTVNVGERFQSKEAMHRGRWLCMCDMGTSKNQGSYYRPQSSRARTSTPPKKERSNL